MQTSYEYQVLISATPEGLSASVVAAMQQAWQLQGGVAVDDDSYHQAMVRILTFEVPGPL